MLDSYELYLRGFGDEALALKFFELFGAGERSFAQVISAADLKELKEFRDASFRLHTKYLRLSRSNKERLDYGFEEETAEKKSLKEWQAERGSKIVGTAIEADDELLEAGFRLNQVDEPEADDEGIFGFLNGPGPKEVTFQKCISNIENSAAATVEFCEAVSTTKRVDYRVCAATFVAKSAWFERAGSAAPKTAHADVPGPFACFLEDILDELFHIYDLPKDSSPSARSALRAVENLTNSHVEFLRYW